MTHQYPDPEETAYLSRYPPLDRDPEYAWDEAPRQASSRWTPGRASLRERSEPNEEDNDFGSFHQDYFDDQEDAPSEWNENSTDSPGNDSDVFSETEGDSEQASSPTKALKRKDDAPSVSSKQGQNLNRGAPRGSRPRGRPRGRGRGGRGIKRGLRDPIEPTPEFKALHSEATMAFIENDYEKAEDLTLQALQINPDMYVAHSLLSEIHTARGDVDKALAAAWYGAHTRPRDTQMWSKIARLILERDENHKEATLRDALYCYSRIISVDKKALEARFQRAALNRELRYNKRAATEYEKILELLPHNTGVLRFLAETYIDIGEPEKALEHYRRTVSYLKVASSQELAEFGWSDVHIIAELHEYQKQFESGISQIKSLSRWLVGRSDENFWDDFNSDDREWDASDDPRRLELPQFVPNVYDPNSYGDGLPLELRIKLGVFRLKSEPNDIWEALRHFEWLDPTDQQGGAKLFDFPDLFREVGKALSEYNFYSEALQYLEPLKQLSEQFQKSDRIEILKCYRELGRLDEAGIEVDIDEDEETGDEDREDIGEGPDRFLDDMELDQQSQILQMRETNSFLKKQSAKKPPTKLSTKIRDPSRLKKVSRASAADENLENLVPLFAKRRKLAVSAGQADTLSGQEWSSLTRRLLRKFQSQGIFYPSDKHQRFTGYPEVVQGGERRIDWREEDLDEGGLGDEPADAFCGVQFTHWLDIFLEFALELARIGQIEESYGVIKSAKEANVFWQSPDFMFSIYVCWFTCALSANDEESMCNIARWFMREYQFVSDCYRLYSALNRLSDSDHTWYNNGPSQKHLLRQIKAMDYSLLGDGVQNRAFQEKASLTTKDKDGQPIKAKEMNVVLLMLYGHVLFAGRGYAYAVNYFYRALALDPHNPSIKLAIALGYVHHALKRQAENRHQLLLQGLAFMQEYHDFQLEKGSASEQNESWYNFGRLYHLIGLTHLAVPCYEHCLASSRLLFEGNDDYKAETFAHEAALGLQNIWAAGGNFERAREVTEEWLRI